MAGKSIEREVGFNTGRTVCDHLDTTRFTIIPLFQTITGDIFILPWRFLHRGKTSDFEHRLEKEAQKIVWEDLKTLVDLIYIAQHGRFGEDGRIQGMLTTLGIPFVGSKVFASALGMDKAVQKVFLQNAGIKTPRGIVIKASQLQHLSATALENQLLHNNLSFPLVIKPSNEGSSFGVSIVTTTEQLIQALHTAAATHHGTLQNVLIEEKIEGMEFSCIVLENPDTNTYFALPATEIVHDTTSNIFTYEQKYMPGRITKYTPARCSENIMQAIYATCIKTVETLEFTTIGRIDGFVRSNGDIIITDPNSFCGMSPSSFAFVQAAQNNMSSTDLINHLIQTECSHLTTTMHIKNDTHLTTTQKIRIAVLLGGRSNEREISLESGRNVVYKLSPHLYDVLPLFVDNNLELYQLDNRLLVFNSTDEIAANITAEKKISWSSLPQRVDFVFIALHGGEGENGTIQATLETLNLPYNGSSVLTSGLCMNKYKTNCFLRHWGFDVPQGALVHAQEFDTLIQTYQSWLEQHKLTFPLIVKPHDDGCSVLVHKVNSIEELTAALHALKNNKKMSALIEECISGMELTVGVIGNDTAQALPPSQAVTTGSILSIEEKFLPGAGENQTPAPLPEKALRSIQHTITDIYTTLECSGYARIDCFYQTAEQSPTGQERVVFIECNTLPALTPATCLFHQAAEIGIKPMDLINIIIQNGFEKHKNNYMVSSNIHIKSVE